MESIDQHSERHSGRAASGLRALLIAPLYACSRRTGGGQRTYHLYEALSRFCELDVLLVSQPESAALEAQYPEHLRSVFPKARSLHLQRSRADTGPAVNRLTARVGQLVQRRESFYRPAGEALRELRELVRGARYDFIAGRYLLQTSWAGAFELTGLPVLLDVDDRDDKVIESRIAAPTTPAFLRPLLRRQLAQTRSVMQGLLGRCAHLWLASQADCDEIAHPSKSVLPNIPYETQPVVPAPVDAATAASSGTVLFVGTYSHRVNRDGVSHFVHNCWPRIRRAVPNATFRIVGSGGWDQLRDKLETEPGVTVVGTVDDLGAEYRGAAFSVVPLLEGSGTKIKILESFRFLRTVVAHSYAARGLDTLRHQQSLLIADTDEAMVDHCITLLNDPTLRRELATCGHDIVVEEYSLQRFARTVYDDVAAALGAQRRAAA